MNKLFNEHNKLSKTLRIVMAGVFAAIIAVLTLITIPTPWGVPFTLQTFIIALCGYICGAKWGTVSVAVYVAVGLVGAPVFAGFKGGFGVLMGPTGGYIIGFITMVFLCGLNSEKLYMRAVFSLLGLLSCHLLGSLWFAFVTSTSILEAFAIASLPYLLKDVISVVCAFVIAKPLNAALTRVCGRNAA
ncbi:MAG: biotin transporter BioY [Ruminiclostridium sp.]